MASLTITVGALSASVTANNTKAAEVLQNFAAAKEYTGTDQEKLNLITAYLAGILTGTARSYAAEQAAKAARETAGSDPDNEWGD
jgi:hypothetical protein